MGYSRFGPALQIRVAWNAGKNVGTKRPLTQKQIWAIRFHLDREGRLRDKALFDLAIDSKLRGCDAAALRTDEVVDVHLVPCAVGDLDRPGQRDRVSFVHLTRLAALRALGVLDTEPDAEFDAITRLAADLFEVPIALVGLVDDDRQ